jgi:CRP-like cAMP-binding protein
MFKSTVAPKKTLAPGQTLFCVDEESEVAYLVREGVLIVSQTSNNGREAITSVYFPGEICGGFAALTGLPHTGTARAPRKASVVVEPIHRSQLLEKVAQDRALYSELLATQREKERFKEGMLLGLMASTCEQRMASALLWLAEKSASSSRPTEKFHLSRQELADLIGTTMETVIRLLSRFRKEGLLEETDGCFKMNLPALAERAQAA